jgi:hypothetical protein
MIGGFYEALHSDGLRFRNVSIWMQEPKKEENSQNTVILLLLTRTMLLPNSYLKQ